MNRVKKAAILLPFVLAAVIMLQRSAVTDTYAANLVLTGDTNGLSITPSNENLFFINGILPGESEASGIEIRNTDEYPFSLSVEVTSMNEDETDLLDVLDINVYMDGREIAEFPASGGRYELGRFLPGQTVMLDVALTINGIEAGNDYQMKGAELLWIFEALSEYEEPFTPPPTNTGGGGGGRGVIVNPQSAEESSPSSPSDVVVIDDIPVPLIEFEGEGEEARPAEEIIEIQDKEVPLTELEMPETGEPSLFSYILAGAVVSCLGLGTLFIKSKKEKEEKEES